MDKSRRRPPIKLPWTEFEFFGLKEREMQACLEYECRRERVKFQRQVILKEAKELEQRCDDKDEKFRGLLELQEELNSLRQMPTKPWLLLRPRERTRLAAPEHADRSEPVRLFSELDRLGQILCHRGRVELVIDWSASTKRLKNSFDKLVERLRKTPGTKANLTPVDDGRGQKASVRQKLLRLVIWRCCIAGLGPEKTLRVMERFQRRAFQVPAEDTLRKKFRSLVREGERIVFPFGRH